MASSPSPAVHPVTSCRNNDRPISGPRATRRPPEDDVDLVLCVGRLLVGRQRPGELYVETTVPQKAYRPLSAGTRDARLSLCEVDYAAVVWFAHAQLLVLPN